MLWPLVAMLALSAGVLVLLVFVGSPQQVRQCGGVLDNVMKNTVDEWLGCDTLTMPGLRPWDFPAFVLLDPIVSSWEPASGVQSPQSAPPNRGVSYAIRQADEAVGGGSILAMAAARLQGKPEASVPGEGPGEPRRRPAGRPPVLIRVDGHGAVAHER